MTTPFQNFRDKLRSAGCRLECAEQVKTTHGFMIEMWRAYPDHGGFVRFMVIDQGAEGYSIFIENSSNKIDSDVEAILSAGLRSIPSATPGD